MNRPTRLMASAMVASAALLLTACGSGGSDNDTADTVKGASDGDEKASASADATSQPDGTKRPEIKLPKSFQVDFTGWKNSDPQLQAILDDGKEELRAKYAAIIEANPESEAVRFYDSGTSLTTARKWIKSFVETDDSLIGEIKAYDPKVNVSSKDSAVFFYCVDESKGSTKDRKTGEVTHTPAKTALVLYWTKLSKSDNGVWKTTTVQTEPGACK
ncbi:hypothetical protein ABZ916_02745 [Streptomyces sp. NPDC046853]|uniref:hypothetical protein n=1 Tax=Streptomyces sp. NPDC046853 TaxID=3154920 RepID=UPI0033C1B0A8